MLNKPFWLRLFSGGLGESHAADLLQHVVGTHNNGRDTLAKDHRTANGGAPTHTGIRWARAVACLDISLVRTGFGEPQETGVVQWSDGFSVPPAIGAQPEAIQNPYNANGWWLNWTLDFDGSESPRQDILIGYEMLDGTEGSMVYERPTDLFRSRFFPNGRVGSFLLSIIAPPETEDDDPFAWNLLPQIRRIFLAVR